MPEITYIKLSMMGFSVLSHDACPVDGKNHLQVLEADVFDDLIVSPLKES